MSRKRACADDCRPSLSAGSSITVQVQRCCKCDKTGVESREELLDAASSSPDDPRETVFYCKKHYAERLKELGLPGG